MDEEYDLGCWHCRSDGPLAFGRCPICDAEYPDEDEEYDA